MDRSLKQRFIIELYLFYRNFLLIITFPLIMTYFSVILLRNLIFFLTPPTKQRLWDFGFEYFPNIEYDFIQNMPQWFLWTSTATLLFAAILKKEFHANKILGVSRFMTVYANLTLMHLLRNVNYHITRVSSPSEYCMNLTDEDKPQNIWQCFYKIYNHTCGDLIFSGHNANAVIIMLNLAAMYFPFSSKKQKIIMVIVFLSAILIQGFFSIATKRYLIK